MATNAKKRKTKRRKKTPARKVFSVICIALLVTGIAGAFWAMSYLSGVMLDAYNFDITKYKMDLASTIYAQDSDGEYVEYQRLHDVERRVWVSIDNIPKHVQDAAVAIEDKRFYEHQGMDLRRTMQAVLGFITNSDSGAGGSTITQQLVKNMTGDDDRSPARKIQEIFRALVLETQLDKSEILEYYLNRVYFGNGSYGIEMAASTYFDKSTDELTIAESAAIIGITKSPSAYNPYTNPEKNKERRETILYEMYDQGKITQDEYDAAVAEKIEFEPKKDIEDLLIYSYFTETLIDEVARDIAEEEDISVESAKSMVYTGGLKIYATVDADIQKKMEDRYEQSSLFPKLSGDVQPQSAMVVMSHDGQVRGVIGGVGEKKANLELNRAVDTLHQPGSSIKPISVYGPAVELGYMTPNTIISDEYYKDKETGWTPQNWDKKFHGNVTMREAVKQSWNIPAIKTLDMIGMSTSVDFLRNKLGITSIVKDDESAKSALALGALTKGASVMEMAGAYTAFANDGIYTKPYTYTKVLDRNGKVLVEKQITSRRVFSVHTAESMTSVLKTTAEGPLGISASISMPSAGKTGTATGMKGSREVDQDRWYIAYTPYYLGAVWYGYDTPDEVPYSATSLVPHRVWKGVMGDIHKNLPYKQFTFSEYVYTAPAMPSESPTESAEPTDQTAVPPAIDGETPQIAVTPDMSPGAVTTPQVTVQTPAVPAPSAPTVAEPPSDTANNAE